MPLGISVLLPVSLPHTQSKRPGGPGRGGRSAEPEGTRDSQTSGGPVPLVGRVLTPSGAAACTRHRTGTVDCFPFLFVSFILPGSSGPMSLQAQAACFQRSEPSENLWSRRAGDVTPGVTLLSSHQVLQFSFGKVAGQTKPADGSRPVSAGPGTCRHLPTHLCSTVKASGVKKAARDPLLEAAMTGSQMGSLVKSVIPVRK